MLNDRNGSETDIRAGYSLSALSDLEARSGPSARPEPAIMLCATSGRS
jgi:hypothetical protein